MRTSTDLPRQLINERDDFVFEDLPVLFRIHGFTLPHSTTANTDAVETYRFQEVQRHRSVEGDTCPNSKTEAGLNSGDGDFDFIRRRHINSIIARIVRSLIDHDSDFITVAEVVSLLRNVIAARPSQLANTYRRAQFQNEVGVGHST